MKGRTIHCWPAEGKAAELERQTACCREILDKGHRPLLYLCASPPIAPLEQKDLSGLMQEMTYALLNLPFADVQMLPATSPALLRYALNRYRPRILCFSGHCFSPHEVQLVKSQIDMELRPGLVLHRDPEILTLSPQICRATGVSSLNFGISTLQIDDSTSGISTPQMDQNAHPQAARGRRPVGRFETIGAQLLSTYIADAGGGLEMMLLCACNSADVAKSVTRDTGVATIAWDSPTLDDMVARFASGAMRTVKEYLTSLAKSIRDHSKRPVLDTRRCFDSAVELIESLRYVQMQDKTYTWIPAENVGNGKITAGACKGTPVAALETRVFWGDPRSISRVVTNTLTKVSRTAKVSFMRARIFISIANDDNMTLLQGAIGKLGLRHVMSQRNSSQITHVYDLPFVIGVPVLYTRDADGKVNEYRLPHGTYSGDGA